MNDWLKLIAVALIAGLIGGFAAGLVGGDQSVLQGSTDDDWSVGGNLTITGISAFTGEVRAPVVELGSLTTPTTGATTTLTAANVCNSNVIEWEPTVANSSTTLPTATLTVADCLTADGDSVTFLFRNISATAASTTIIGAGAGNVLLEPDGQDVVIAGGNAALITMFRVSSTALAIIVDELIDAD